MLAISERLVLGLEWRSVAKFFTMPLTPKPPPLILQLFFDSLSCLLEKKNFEEALPYVNLQKFGQPPVPNVQDSSK